MQYSQSHEKATEFSAKALEKIQKIGLPPTPETYELWYVYFAGLNPEVTRAIDILESNAQDITSDRCRELHQRFLSETKENERVRSAGDKIHETIKGVTGAVSNVKSATAQYNDTLSDAKNKFASEEMNKEQMEKTLALVLNDTEDMISKNKVLEDELSKSSVIMQELRRDLEMVRKEALTDGLTNLANRKAFDVEIERIIEESRRESNTFSLLLMDIDHFKSFNDNFGHQVGDQVLRLVAHTLIDGVKGRDMACRYGGEEFAILLPNTNIEGALKVGDLLRRAVESKDIINRSTGEKMGTITLSGGVAEFLPSEESPDLIERADVALYTAKRNGRNKICAADPPGKKQAS